MEAISNSKTNVKILINIIYVVSAIALPQIFHLFGMGGPMFLPMHIPVLLAGFTLGPKYGLVTRNGISNNKYIFNRNACSISNDANNDI